MLDLFEQPGTKRFMVKTRNIVKATMTILDTRLRMVERIPAWHQRWPRKQVAITPYAQMHLQTRVVRLTEATLQVARPTRLFLLVNRVHNAVRANSTNLLKVLLHHFGAE